MSRISGIAVFIFAAAIPITDMSRYFIGFGSVSEFMIPVLVGLAFVSVISKTKRYDSILTSKITAGLFIWAAINIISWLAADTQEVNSLVRVLEYLCAYISIAVLCSGARSADYYIKGMVAGGLIAAGMCIVHWVMGPSYYFFQNWAGIDEGWYYSAHNFRVHGSFGNPLNTVMYLSVMVGIYYILAKHSRNKWSYIIVVCLMIFALQLTGSKSSLIAPLVLLVLERRFKVIAIIVLISIAAYYLGAFDTLVMRMLMRESFDDSVMQRLYVLDSALKITLDNFLIGVGPGNFADAYVDYKNPRASLLLSSYTAENQILQYAAEIGVIGTGILVFAIWKTFRFGFMNNKMLSGVNFDQSHVNTHAVSIALVMYVSVTMIQSATSADLSMLLFSMIGFQEAQRVMRRDVRRSSVVLPATARKHGYAIS